jgi:glycosyltransferase involved in cell wall biosynthesis
MRLLFIKESLAWPRSSGHDVHCFYLMKALAQLGHEVALGTVVSPLTEALGSLPLARRFVLDDLTSEDNGHRSPRFPYWQERFRSYWGIPSHRVMAVNHAARAFQADAVIVVGLNVLPYLEAVRGPLRIWYAADEWVLHHLAQVNWREVTTWSNLRQAMVKGLYERAFGSLLDRVWVVSEADRRVMRWVSGVKGIDVLPNGVDGDYYSPLAVPPIERSCVFWGRLDFGPNLQALKWFCGRVWPALRQQAPDARFTIFGFQPTAEANALAGRDGIDLVANRADIRSEIARHAIVVLPFVSGGGIKNKLLEAASMGKAIICTPQACGGLLAKMSAPFVQARQADEWVRKILNLWTDPERRQGLGHQARQWVLAHHTWEAAARTALRGLGQPLPFSNSRLSCFRVSLGIQTRKQETTKKESRN